MAAMFIKIFWTLVIGENLLAFYKSGIQWNLIQTNWGERVFR